ncbi:MAG: SGNH/GDSL hydrolase family protein [Candidatus Eisenbacteria bacterium]|uniref:SGNH/GDSL hydrolase family protein n=1 Tax=Eiseniibacteriota bacterium TaxID=2212470 RepID=A0A956NB36_UNCEI|nr:SGNH/GDSL hydrolase family protein [Candidatus Eisenbacteria bacterium]
MGGMTPGESTSPPGHGRTLSALLILFGFFCLAALIFTSPLLLEHFADDKVLDAHGLEVIRRARIEIVALGVGLILFGSACRRWGLLRFLDGRDWAAKWFLLLLTGGFLLGVSEVFFQARPIASREEQLSHSLAYDVSAFSINRLADFDQDVSDSAPGVVRAYVRNGYRGRGFPAAKPPGEIRIVILGGSFVFDTSAREEDDWPHRVETLLREEGFNGVRIINGGVPGHSSFDSIGRLVSEVHFYNPDIVLLCNAWNDIKYMNQISPEQTPLRYIRPMSRPTHEHYPPSPVLRLLDRVHLFRILAALPGMFAHYGDEGRLPEGEYSDSVSQAGIDQYTLNLRTFVDICRNFGAEPVLVTQPHLPTPENRAEVVDRIRYDWVLLSHEALCRAFQACEDADRAVAEEKGCRLIELSNPLSGRLDLFTDHVHVNGKGSREVASLVARALADDLAGRRESAPHGE